MDPDSPNQQPQNPLPGHQPSSGSDWQRQAVAAARSSQQPPQSTAPQAGAPQAAAPGVPDWQQGFHRNPQQAGQSEPPVPDMLAAADPQPAQPPRPQAPPLPPMPQPTAASNIQPGQPIVSGVFGEDVAAVPVTGTGGPNPRKRIIIAVVGLVVFLSLAAGAYSIFFAGGDKSVDRATEESNRTADANAIDMSSINNVIFTAPDLTAFHKSEPASGATYSAYLTADDKCSISFGTASASLRPGNNIQEVIGQQLDLLRSNGFTVEGPDAAEALVIKDADEPSRTYKMPTMVFKAYKDNVSAVSHYSIVILKNGNRAVVDRSCADDTGAAVSADRVAEMDAKAKELKVTPEL